MATDDESQVAEDFGMMARMITGSAMQLRESQLRRRALNDQRAQADAAAVERSRAAHERMQANAGRVIQHDLYSREFWRTASSESIADRLAVAAALGEHDPAARSAWMHGADVLRTEYGIDMQEINRENPSSLADRHAALRDALDDHFAQYQQDRADDAAAEDRAAEVQSETEADRSEAEAAKAEVAEPNEEKTADTSGVAARGELKRESKEAEADAARSEHMDDLTMMHRRDMAHLSGIEDKQLSSVRRVQLSSFPNQPHVVDPAKLHRTPKKARQAPAQNRERQEVLAR